MDRIYVFKVISNKKKDENEMNVESDGLEEPWNYCFIRQIALL